jgi:hypothetical protein
VANHFNGLVDAVVPVRAVGGLLVTLIRQVLEPAESAITYSSVRNRRWLLPDLATIRSRANDAIVGRWPLPTPPPEAWPEMFQWSSTQDLDGLLWCDRLQSRIHDTEDSVVNKERQ